METIINHLKAEHVLIKRILEVLKKVSVKMTEGNELSADRFERLLKAIELIVRKVHHEKEEQILFPRLSDIPLLTEGGPNCTLFFSYHIDGSSGKKILKYSKDENLPTTGYCHSKISQSFIDKNSHLAIPLSDHEMGFYGLQLLWHYLDIYKKTQEPLSLRFINVVDAYVEHMELHIRKEDECLFPMVDKLISVAEQQSLYQEALKIEASTLCLEEAKASILSEYSLLLTELD